ncbi:TonB-dependent receptor-like protein [Pseudoduganella flava]|uniref:TonB-dependent receptor plug domain-containing protein n=1 Tax=Pseudoduganella flava TaxID=871742 RepID=A0A562Q3W1_9BURK|nr:TonB-dependent receptor [Pseudoduganella flava]QGZ41465.1 TonB-dependent receptor plug domain-containing protein [Pseudoduganella flava]TWI51422.1 TonB-dependent receptor-like protein [Pseudoduganella flava]
MKEKLLSRSVRLVCLGGMLVSMNAMAQEAPIQQVQVTGSRIPSPNAESSSPLQVLTATDIAASGVTNLQELLLKNPTLGAPAISRTNSNFTTSSAGVSTVDLRSLGTSRTLVLVNGRRFVAGVPGETAVDLNVIPTDFIERVDMLTGGASSTYGSDAVAGVVNIITKRNFNGIIVDAQGGQSTKHDDTKKKFSLTWGTSNAEGTSNIMTHFGYSKQGVVYSKDRPASAVDQNSAGDPDDLFKVTRPFYSSYAPQGRFFYDDGTYTYDRNGTPIPWNTNGTNGQQATGFNRSEYRSIAVPTDRYLLATTGTLALNENHNIFFEGNYAATRVSTRIEPFALGAEDIYPATGGQVPAEFLVNGVLRRNPIVPQYLYDRISDTDGDGLRDYYFTRRLSEVGTRGSKANRDTFRLATGVNGNFNLLREWKYETYIAYGQTKESQSSTGQVNVLNFRNALEAYQDVNDENNNNNRTEVICRDPNARLQGCVPINVFGYNTISPEALKYVTAPGSLETKITQKLAGGSISGEIFDLPAGKVGAAVGFEWRGEESSSEADALTQAGLNAGNALPPTFGKFNVKEAFAELRVPILKDQPFARSLDFSGAVRRGNYSTVGYTTSWNAGLEWSPIKDFRFRATRALSTRAPNINELYQPPQQTFPADIVDPCVGVTATSQGARDAACRAAPGVMANIQTNGSFTLTQPDIQGISGYDRGNPNLKAEKGWSTTVGLVWTPTNIPAIKNFTFTIDYFDIKIADALVFMPRQYALQNCYEGDGSLCGLITRRPAEVGANSAGSLEYIDSPVSNSGGKATEGVDVTASWAGRVGPGRLTSRLSWTWLRQGYDVPAPGAPRDYWAGELDVAAKNRASLNLAYKWGPVSISGTTQYIGKAALDDQFLAQLDIPRNGVMIGSKTYQDFQVNYEFRKKWELYLGIDNAFNTKAPPIVSGLPGSDTGTETAAGVYDPIGRRYYAGLRVTL